MRLTRPLSTISALTLALSFAACGAGNEETEIRDGLEEALTSTSPSACSSGYTKAFLNQGSYGSSAVAASFCRSNIKALAAKKVDVSDVRVDGDSAEADLSASGGQYAFKSATVALRKTDGEWRLDRLEKLDLERPEYDRRQERLAVRQKGGFTRGVAACYRRRIERVSEERLSKAIVASDPSYLAEPMLACVVRPTLLGRGLSVRRTRCIMRRVRGRSARTFARLALARTKTTQRAINGRFRRAADACASR